MFPTHYQREKERLLVVDDRNASTKKVKRRSDIHQDGDWHRVTAVYIIHPKKGILCHQRSDKVENFALKWQPYIGGHILFDETPVENAIKKIKEEIGLRASIHQLRKGPARQDPQEKEWICTFIFNFTGKTENIHFADQEVSQITFLSYDRILSSMKKEPKRWASRIGSFLEMKKFLFIQ